MIEHTNSATNQLFANLNVINTKTSDQTIDQILGIAGANLIDFTKNYTFASPSEMFIILVDSHDYNHKVVLGIYDKFNLNSNVVHIVTIEWLVACLEYGYIVDFNCQPRDSLYSSNLFLPPTSVATSPYCIKVQLDIVERYSKYDIIRYFCVNGTAQIGQIIDIRYQDSVLACHILPLHVSDKKIVGKIQNNAKELEAIEPEKIIQRVSVYTMDTYTKYKYSLVDDNIYCIE